MDYTAAREERLFVDRDGVSREVPPMQERPHIIKEYHATLAMLGRQRKRVSRHCHKHGILHSGLYLVDGHRLMAKLNGLTEKSNSLFVSMC